jgi:hypothetical protein
VSRFESGGSGSFTHGDRVILLAENPDFINDLQEIKVPVV